MKILVMGLPGTPLSLVARELALRLKAVHFEENEFLHNVPVEVGVAREDGVKIAASIGWLCEKVTEAGGNAVAAFTCPTQDAREAFGEHDLLVWLNMPTVSSPILEQIFEPPDADVVVETDHIESSVRMVLEFLSPHSSAERASAF